MTDYRMKKIAFIINPVSGAKKQQDIKRTLPGCLSQILDSTQWSVSIAQTEYAGHATLLAQQYATQGFDAVVAVGGDGTVNEIACGLRDTQTAMAILPMGSGNGLARHLHIPMDVNKAIDLLNHCEPMRIDYGLANDRLFVCTCGTGFDATVAERFAGNTRRGFMTYIRTVIRLVFTYRSLSYHITGEGLDETHRAFLITFANANQWGNEAIIAPKANLQDGKMDIMIMSPNALWGSLPLAVRLFAGNIDRSPMIQTLRAGDILLQRECAAAFHIDGDPVQIGQDIRIRIVKAGLSVLVPKP